MYNPLSRWRQKEHKLKASLGHNVPFMTSIGYIVRPHFGVGRKEERSVRKQSKEGLRREKEKVREMGRRLGRGERKKAIVQWVLQSLLS